MMLTRYFPAELVSLDMKSTNKWDLLNEMSLFMAESKEGMRCGVNSEIIQAGIISREQNMTTGLGKGLAFPHTRHPDIRNLLVGMAILKQPIDFESIDGKPVDIVCMILAPEEQPTMAIKVRSRVAKLLTNDEFRSRIVNINTREEAHDLISQMSISLDVPITAEDIMHPPMFSVREHTPLKEVISLMSQHHSFAVPVVDETNRIIGEITCDRLFRFGIPDFFSQLKSISFIAEFDPFEKYFYAEAHSKAQDLMSENFKTMEKDATILEIVFALTVQKYPKIYVVQDNKHIGEIDQSLVLDRIMRL